MTIPLTNERIAELWAEMRSGLPGQSSHVYHYAMACRVWEHYLGHEWVRGKISRSATADPYFRWPEREMDGSERVVHMHRVIRGAMRLRNVDGVTGFDHLVRDLQTRELDGAIAEVVAVDGLVRAGHPVRFVRRQGVRGRDFDAWATVRSVDVAVEVKATAFDSDSEPERSIKNKIHDARPQLPAAGPGLLVICVPPNWVGSPDAVARLDAAAKAQLRRTGRISAVVLLADVVFVQGDPTSDHARWAVGDWFYVIPNVRARVKVRNVLNVWQPLSVQAVQL